MNKALNLLGLMMRSGNIVTGEDIIIKNIKNKSIKLLVIATDCGKNTKKNLVDKSEYYHIDKIEIFTTDELSKAIGKDNRVALGITDLGFSKKFKELVNI